MSDDKNKIDESITTIRDFKIATNSINPDAQMYVQRTGLGDDDSALVEVTELFLRLPKLPGELPYLILRTK